MTTVVKELEEVTEQVSDWAVEIITTAIGKFAPDDTGFGEYKLSPEEQVLEYAKIRGNPGEWYKWIDNQAQTLIQSLSQSGVPVEQIHALHPYDIAFRLAAKYSLDMEPKFKEKFNA